MAGSGGGGQQLPFRDQPGMVPDVVDTHRAAQYDQAGHRPRLGQGITSVDPHHLVTEADVDQRLTDEPRTFVGHVLDDAPGRPVGAFIPGVEPSH